MIYKNSVIKSITANWIDENNFNYKHDVKFEFASDLLDKLIDIPFCLPEKNILENITLLDKYIINISYVC